jgi:hypothetical protein
MYTSHFYLHWNILQPDFQNRPTGTTTTDLRVAVIRKTYELAQDKNNLFLRVSSHTLRAAATSLPRLRSNLAQYECKSNSSSTPSWGDRNSAASWYHMHINNSSKIKLCKANMSQWKSYHKCLPNQLEIQSIRHPPPQTINSSKINLQILQPRNQPTIKDKIIRNSYKIIAHFIQEIADWIKKIPSSPLLELEKNTALLVQIPENMYLYIKYIGSSLK